MTFSTKMTNKIISSHHHYLQLPQQCFSTYNMIDNKEEVPTPEAYLFSLHPSQPSSRKPNVMHSFAPVLCRKTYKLIRTIPTYHPNLDLPFQSEASLQVQSMRELLLAPFPDRREGPCPIMVARPTHHFCQICKQSFEDYLKHITHPLHQRRSRQTDDSLDIDSLKEALEVKRKKGKKITWFEDTDSNCTERQKEREEETKSVTSLEELELRSQGSKKRIIFREGEMEPISVQNSTKCQEEDIQCYPPTSAHRRNNRKFSNFRQVVED